MGYDMHMRRAPVEAPEGHLPQYEGQPGYHRFNLRAMSVMLGAMEWAACLHYAPAPVWPEFPEFMTDDRAIAVMIFLEHEDDGELDGVAPSDRERAAMEAYIAARQAVREVDSLRDGSVGKYKLLSNDGWWVNPGECRAIAAAVRSHAAVIAADFLTDAGWGEAQGLSWLKSWADFNALAAEHGGYCVR